MRYTPFVLTFKTSNLNGGTTPEYYALDEQPVSEQRKNRAFQRVFGYYPAFYKLIHRKEARLIHAHFGFCGYDAIRLAKRANVPLVTTFYGFDASRIPRLYPIWQKKYRDLFRFGSCFLVEGHHMRQQLIDLGCPAEKIKVQHLGIRLDELPFQARRWQNGEPLKILIAGRFTEKKGIVYAVEALAHLILQGISAHLTIIGDAPKTDDIPFRKETQAAKQQILDTIERHALKDNITLLGMQPYEVLKKTYYEHHIFLSPSVQAASGDNEGGAPVTIIEAAASGMPVVASAHCDIPEVVLNGITGLLAPERDSEALARQLMTFIKNPRQFSEMGAAARQHIEAEYDAIKQGERLAAIYDEILLKDKGCHAVPRKRCLW